MKLSRSKIIIGVLITTLIILCLIKFNITIDFNDKYVPFFVGILVSITSLIGVWVTNFFNNKHNLNPQKFESDQKEHERIHSMRKEIYLKIVDLTVLLRKDIFGEYGLVQFSQDLKIEIDDSSQFFEDMMNKIKLNK
ncbi:hypothetical protein [Acinetobacter nosocomialis]|nr:hypothetical protein [Acinetobacter nosocomialis]MBR7716206.1 hypothetical protein [Acinetobacter nosocomialis]